jgi:hypothetical protein
MSEGWADLRRSLPGLRGARVHVLAAALEPRVREVLAAAGVRVHDLEGADVVDKDSFMRAVAAALPLPAYFGGTWDSLNDCLGDLAEDSGTRAGQRMAVLWMHAERCAASDLQTLLDAAVAFDAASIEVFLLGEGPGFV